MIVFISFLTDLIKAKEKKKQVQEIMIDFYDTFKKRLKSGDKIIHDTSRWTCLTSMAIGHQYSALKVKEF